MGVCNDSLRSSDNEVSDNKENRKMKARLVGEQAILKAYALPLIEE